jgi:diguanylate cyclase (GGDEF)-like protein
MPASPTDPTQVVTSPASGSPTRRLLLSALTILAESAAFIGLTFLLVSGKLIQALELLQLMLAAALPIVVIYAAARRRRRYTEPLARMLKLLPQARDGEQPIESLTSVGGALAPLAAICRELLRDRRHEQLRVRQLEEETRQRVAHRTEALERTIGSLRNQASRDGLTGLMNRRALDVYLPDAIDRCKHAGIGMCVLMLDIDYFKPLNDMLGHATGDEMLKSLAQIIRSTIPDTDGAFRCGGDEFVVVLEDHSPAAGAAVAERIGSLADAFGKTFRVPNPPRLSIGMSNLAEAKDRTAGGLLAAADEQLYKVKSAHHGIARSRRSA